jgi:hypothetical protein
MTILRKKEEDDWERFYLLHQGEFRAMAREALNNLENGFTNEMLFVDGRMAFA